MGEKMSFVVPSLYTRSMIVVPHRTEKNRHHHQVIGTQLVCMCVVCVAILQIVNRCQLYEQPINWNSLMEKLYPKLYTGMSHA